MSAKRNSESRVPVVQWERRLVDDGQMMTEMILEEVLLLAVPRLVSVLGHLKASSSLLLKKKRLNKVYA
jgi:hypothetical protein